MNHQERVMHFALMREAAPQMPETLLRDLHAWEAANLPNRGTSEWPRWEEAFTYLSDDQIQSARDAAKRFTAHE